MARQRRAFSEEFKAEAIALVVSTGKPVVHVPRDLGINVNRPRLFAAPIRVRISVEGRVVGLLELHGRPTLPARPTSRAGNVVRTPAATG